MIDGGYISAADSVYHFFVTDHLGSVRVVARADGTVEKCYDYDPYGADLYNNQGTTVPDTNPYKFGGKELDQVLSNYNFGARLFGPSKRRWTTMDPYCWKYYSISPYAYCAGNPVNIVDPEGKEIWIIVPETNIYVQYSGGELFNQDGSIYQGEDSFVNQIKESLDEMLALGDDYITHVINTLDKSKEKHTFAYDKKYIDSTRARGEMGNSFANEGVPVGSWVLLSLQRENVDGVPNNSLTTIAHEIAHSYDYDQGKMKGNLPWGGNEIEPTEIRAVNFENRIRVRIGMPRRTKYTKPLSQEALENPWFKKKY